MDIASIKDVIVALCAIAGVGVAVAGLSTWNRQIKGQAWYELARQILRKTYEFRKKIRELRRELISVLDHEEIKKLTTDNDSRVPSVFPKYLDKLNDIITASTDLWAEIEIDFVEAEVIWEINLQNDFKDLSQIEWRQIADAMFLRFIFISTYDNAPITQENQKFLCKIRNTYDKLTEAEFEEVLKKSVLQAGSQVKKKLKRL